MKTINDIYQNVTDEIVRAIEAGCGDWKMPWNCKGALNSIPVNVATEKPYRGVNILVLWARSVREGYTDGTWGTFQQWKQLGGTIRKGERSTPVVFWKTARRESLEDETEDGERVLFAKTYHVFNVAQVDGLPKEENENEEKEENRIENAERFFSSLPLTLKEAPRAFYLPSEDAVYMPPFKTFFKPEGYYGTLAHEVTHWTGHKSRLNRDLTGRFKSESYAMEELIAELGAAFLSATLNVESSMREDHAAYIQTWLKVLKEDKRAIFTAASKAQQAVDWMVQVTAEEKKAA